MIIWLSDIDEASVWIADDGTFGHAADLRDIPLTEPAAIIMPGQWARMHALDLPKMRASERTAAAGFTIEDKVGAALEAQHLVLPADGHRVGLITNSKMRALMQALDAADINVAGVYADYDVIAPGPAIKLAGRVIVPHDVTGGTAGYAVDAPFFEGVDRLETLEPQSVNITTDAALNFATGNFAPAGRGFLSARTLTRAAAMLAVLGVSVLAWQFAQGRAAQSQAAYLKAQTDALYTQATGAPAPANPALAVTRAMKSGASQDADFLSLSALLFKAMEATPGAQIETLDYDAARPQLRVRILYPDLQTATRMERAVASLGGVLSTGNLRDRDGDMMGDAVLTGKGR